MRARLAATLSAASNLGSWAFRRNIGVAPHRSYMKYLHTLSYRVRHGTRKR